MNKGEIGERFRDFVRPRKIDKYRGEKIRTRGRTTVPSANS